MTMNDRVVSEVQVAVGVAVHDTTPVKSAISVPLAVVIEVVDSSVLLVLQQQISHIDCFKIYCWIADHHKDSHSQVS
jgi:hypothetical protein